MIRENIGNTVVRFFDNKEAAKFQANYQQGQLFEYQKSGLFFWADKYDRRMVYDEFGLIFNVRSLEQSPQYQEDFKSLMEKSVLVS